MLRKEHALPYKGVLEGYVVNFLNRNHWRVQGYLDRDEVMQESYLTYLRLVDKYPDVEAKHLMALYKTAWGNYFTDLANASSRQPKQISQVSEEVESVEYVGELENSGFLRILIAQAPAEIKQVLLLFLHAPSEVYESFFDINQREYNSYKNRNQVINRLLGFSKNRDILSEVKSYFL